MDPACSPAGLAGSVTDPTQAKQVRTKSGQNTRRYSWPPVAPHEFTVTSVTSALKSIPKPFLVPWACKVTAEGAIRDFDIIQAMLKKHDGKKAAIQHVKGAMNRDSGAKGDRGTIVHAAIDAYLKGKPMSDKDVANLIDEKFIPDSLGATTAGMIHGAMEFLWDTEPEIHWNESTIFSRQHMYGGTADLIASIQIGGAVHPAVIDFKTSKAIYDEVALQLCAYARADFVGLNDGTESPLLAPDHPEHGQPIKYGVVIRPKADGSYERADYILGDEVFELFLSLLKTSVLMDDDILKTARRPTVQ